MARLSKSEADQNLKPKGMGAHGQSDRNSKPIPNASSIAANPITTMIAMIPACAAGDALTGFSIFWLALGCALAIPQEALTKTIVLLEGARRAGSGMKAEMPAGLPTSVD